MPNNRKPYTPPTAAIIRMTDAEALRILSRERECVQQHLDVAADGGGYVSPDGMIRALDYVEACAVAIAALHERQRKPVTNADHNRSMSDKELARFLAEVENRRSAAGGGAIWKGAAHALEWLRQPVKEEPYE